MKTKKENKCPSMYLVFGLFMFMLGHILSWGF